MRFQGLDLNLLVALDALLTEQNVSAAAERIHLSQSAMSGALNRLREYFKDELLTPMGRRMVRTPRGEQLATPVRTALLQIRATVTTRPEFDPATCDRRFSIMASDYATVVGLADGLRAIELLAPAMSFHISPVGSNAAALLERGEIDFLITLDRYISADHPHQLLFEDDYVVVAWTGNTRLGDELDELAYFELGHVIVEFDDRTPVFDEWYLRSGRRTRRAQMTAPSFTLAPHLLVGTNRIATMHRRLAMLFAANLPLRVFPVPFEIPRIRQVIQWHRFAETDPATAWVKARLKEVFQAGCGASTISAARAMNGATTAESTAP